ncbi:MAG: peptidoglycan-associated lipoprotein Pal [Gammaproteobacteria bacterium]|nr:MAG: peptidoglycan-associated lipoprotein Pal [Gammaproteobacteria bacterium]
MKLYKLVKPWMIAGTLAIFVSACATTQEEYIEEDGAPVDDQSTSTAIVDDGSSGADATGLDDGDTVEEIIIADDSTMTALDRLEKTDGPLSSRIIYFELDSAKLTSESIEILEVHGNFIAGNGEVAVRLEGHADERGSREYNIALGDRRAQSVRRVLLFQGASVDQVETVSYGEEQPAVTDQTEEAWSLNRRVELIYTVN